MRKIFLFLMLFIFGICIVSCDNKKTNTEVTEVIELIDKLPENISLDDEAILINIKSKYDLLSSTDKAQVTNYQVLENKFLELENLKIELDNQKQIEKVINAIASLPSINELTITDEEKLINARNLYEALNHELKTKVTNLNVLESCEKALELLKQNNDAASYVIELINNLPTIEDLKLTDKETVLGVQNTYDNLTDVVKNLITNVDKLNSLVEIVNEFDSVENVISVINNLPNVSDLTLNDEEKLITARNLYEALNSKVKKYVTNLNVLESCEKALELLKQNNDAASYVIELINNLPTIEDLKLTDKETVLGVQNTYDNLTDVVKNLITNVDKLNSLVEIVSEFDSVENVISVINNLPNVSDLTLNDEEKLIAARNLYEALNSKVKKYVTNLNVLESCEKAFNVIKDIYDSGNAVISLIDSLPSADAVSLSDKALVESARNSYNELSDDAKKLVNNLSKLEALEEKIIYLEQFEIYKKNALVVIELINQLPSDVTLNDEEQINKCIDAYNGLLPVEQELVTNYETLMSKKEKLEEIIANTNYEVKVELDGGYLENMIEVEKTETICEFVVNNYSCNIWTVYSSNIFIYKTSLMKAEDKFTSFLKVGLVVDSKTNGYVVSQKIVAGTALDEAKRTSDYYILIHPDYSEGYGKVNKINLGHKINVNKQFPDASIDSLNATISVVGISSESDYYISLKGTNTLPSPQKAGYKFVGWYLEKEFINKVTEVKESTTVYARWVQDQGDIMTENILNCVSDIATSDTIDELVLENDDATFIWSSSNNNLYNIKDGIGTVSKIYQTHKKQTVKVTVEIAYKTGGSKTLSKDITVNPVLFNDFSSTPIATYFYTGAISAYKKYNERYQSNQTLFSDTTKETLDIVYYAFIVPKSDGSVSFQNTSYLNEVKELKNHNVRILGCVNGVGTDTSTAFKVITADATLRKTFINNLMNLVETYNLDGLDLDWEAVSSSLKPIASQYNLLCEELRAEMTRRQDEGGSPYLLTMAVPASSYGTATDRFDFKTLNKYVDYINIMSYDLNDTTKATHLSPLYTSTKDNGYGFGAVYGVNRISSLGFDKNKLIIGCAGYGKAYKVSSGSGTYPALGTSATLTKISGYDGSYASGTVYGSVINQLIKTGNYKQYTELDSSGRVVGSYLYSANDNIFITFDSKEAVMAKYEYASSIGVGMMCWAYTEDTSDTVIDAIYEAKNK